MRTLRFLALSAGLLSAGTLILIACGDDDGVVLDVSDSGVDVQQSDSSHPAIDSGGEPDATPAEAGITDAGDGGLTFFDAATYDAGPDAGFVPDAGTAAVQLADVFCNAVARCCFGDGTLQQGAAVPDGGTYNRSLCISDYGGNGFEQANRGASVNPNHVIVDQTGSDGCAKKLEALSCNLGFAEFAAIRDACYAALLGTQGPGESCTVTAECQKGLFCANPDAGAASGVCALIRDTGATCGDETSQANDVQHICSYRYSGEPPRHCDFVDYSSGSGVLRPQSTWTCKDDLALGSKCANSAWCANGICDSTHTCVASTSYFTPATCTRYHSP